MKKILLIGCGNLGQIILNGLLKENRKVYVIEKNTNITSKINHKNCFFVKNINEQLLKQVSCILLCVKPNQAKDILKKFAKKSNDQVIISFIAGIKISTIMKTLSNTKQKVIRLMPNIFIQFNKSSNAIYSKNLKSHEKKEYEKILSFFGYFIWLKSEDDFNFFTAMFGGGPAYFLYIMKCFNEISQKNKINENDSVNLLLKLLEGVTELIKKYPKDFSSFIKKVTSKGGTTEEAMKVLEEKHFLLKKLNTALNMAKKKSVALEKKNN